MSTEENKSETQQNDPSAETQTSTGSDAEATPQQAAANEQSPTSEPPTDPVAALQEENADLKDKLVRTLADMENLRARTEREKADMAKYAIANFARDILTIGDNLSRAKQAVPEDAVEKDSALKGLMEGVEITNRELHITLERHGVKQIAAKNEPFDPNLHDALFEVPNPDINAGMVVEEIHAGYTIGDRVLRPAAVGVSKGGPKIVKEDNGPQETAKPEQASENTSETKASDAPENKAEEPVEKPDTSGSDNIGEQVDKSA